MMAKAQAPASETIFKRREQILALPSLAQEKLWIPEWNCHVIVREMTAGEQDRRNATMMLVKRDGDAEIKIEQVRAKVVVQCVLDEDGAPLFQPSDVFKIAAMGSKVISRIYAVIDRLSTLRDEEVEGAEENLSEMPIGDSSTASL